MPRETFSRSVPIAVSASQAWDAITDVPTLVGWVGLVHEATTVAEMEQYQAVLRDKLGIFSLKADLDIRVLEYEPARYVVVRAEGEDRQVRSRIVVQARVDLSNPPEGEPARLAVDGSYEVSGRVATLGAATIRTKAQHVLDEFFDHVRSELG